MKKTILFLPLLILVSCTDVLEKPINADDLPEVIERIENSDQYTATEKQYITDNLKESSGVVQLAGALEMELPTFSDEIESYSQSYNEKLEKYTNQNENNKRLEQFVKVTDALSYSISQRSGGLVLSVDLSNPFDKDILFAVVEYTYTNRYGDQLLSDGFRITDEVAGDFTGTHELTLTAQDDELARFLFSEVPSRANDQLAEEIGRDEANEKVNREFLMSGLEFNVLGVRFDDHSEIEYREIDWPYFNLN